MADGFYLGARLYQLALTEELLGTDAGGWHRFTGGGRVHASHTSLASGSSSIPVPSTWPFGGDAIPIVDSEGGALLPLVAPDGAALLPGVLHAYQRAAGADPFDPSCPLFQPAGFAGADNTALANYGAAAVWTVLDPSLPELAVVRQCNASCWANSSCGAWDLIKVTPSSGKTRPTCGQYAVGVAYGCRADPNQWAGAKAPLPLPPPPTTVTQVWTLPLSWVGRALTAVTLTPEGEAPGPGVRVEGRKLSLLNMTPSWPVRLTAAGL